MKIAFIGQKGIPTLSGGVEKHVEKLAVRLARLGHEVTVYTRPHYTPKEQTEFEGVRLVSLPSIKTKHLDAISHTLIATLHAIFQNYDILHYQSIGPSTLSFLPRLLRPGLRVVATFHSRDYFHKKWGAFARNCLRMAEFFTCRVPEVTITISETLAAYAKRAYRKELIYIPNGAEVTRKDDPERLKSFGLKPRQYALSVSRLVEHKGVHQIIKAFQDLEDTATLPNGYKLVIVGTHANTPEYERYLKLLAYGRHNIVFLGERRGAELDAIFSQAGLFIQPSEDEGLSLALLEAMAYALPVIVSDIPANLEAVRGETGRVFPVNQLAGLKREMAYLINRPADAAVLGQAAKKRIEEHYSWDAIAKKTLETYEGLLKDKAVKSHSLFGSKHAV